MWNRGLSVCAVLVLAMAVAPVASASPTANWQAGVQVGVPGDVAPSPNAQVSITSIACPSPGRCVAVGDYRDNSNQSQSLLLTETAGTWAAGVNPTLPMDGVSSSLESVSCPSAGNCTAVGAYSDGLGHAFGLIVTESSGTWSAGIAAPLPNNAATPNPSASLTAVSCPSVGNCGAVGRYNHDLGTHGILLTESGGSWTVVEAALPTGAAMDPQVELESVSCPSANNCGAVGDYHDSSGSQGLLLTESSGSWAPGVEAMLPGDAGAIPNASVNRVSCPAAGECSAVGSYLNGAGHGETALLNEVSSVWAAGNEAVPPDGLATDLEVDPGSVSCPSAGNCSAVGKYADNAGGFHGLLLTESSRTWATGTEAMLPSNAGPQNGHLSISSIACTSVGNCAAFGEYGDTTPQFQGFFLTESSGTWGAGQEATFPGQGTNQGAFSGQVSCASVAACSATGGYSDSSGNQLGALFNTAPASPTLSVTAPTVGDAGAAIDPSSVSATLASGMSPLGTIAFTVFGPQSSPPTSCGSGGTALGSATVVGNGTYRPASGFTPPGAGDYWWFASYGGDASDSPVGSSCGPLMAKTVVPGPVLSKFRQSHRRWREPSKSAKHEPSVGTTFRFTLNQSGTVRLVFSKRLPGRMEKHRCVAPTKHNRNRPACTRKVVAGRLKLAAKAGHHKLVFEGKTSGHHELSTGTYTVTITATNANGTSAPQSLTFTIVP